MFHILACQQLNPDQNGQKNFVIFFLTFPFPFLYFLAATGKIWGGLKALAAKPKAEEVSYLDNCPRQTPVTAQPWIIALLKSSLEEIHLCRDLVTPGETLQALGARGWLDRPSCWEEIDLYVHVYIEKKKLLRQPIKCPVLNCFSRQQTGS